MKKMFLASILALSLCACSNPAASSGTDAQKPEEQVQEQTQETAEPLGSQEILDAVFNELNVSLSKVDDIKISVPDDKDNVTVTFTFNGEEYFCKVNEMTGEIVEHNVPDDIAAQAQKIEDPFEAAINASFDQLEGYSGGAEDIKVSQNGTTYVVEFNWNGEHYTFNYDVNEGKIVD
ncbi:MAG: hypothetical protein E7185_00675 [Erysipelotrichaceae bacterium]|nr:hypothetical protein [Erysipelotrichaceae bacterium]